MLIKSLFSTRTFPNKSTAGLSLSISSAQGNIVLQPSDMKHHQILNLYYKIYLMQAKSFDV